MVVAAVLLLLQKTEPGSLPPFRTRTNHRVTAATARNKRIIGSAVFTTNAAALITITAIIIIIIIVIVIIILLGIFITNAMVAMINLVKPFLLLLLIHDYSRMKHKDYIMLLVIQFASSCCVFRFRSIDGPVAESNVNTLALVLILL